MQLAKRQRAMLGEMGIRVWQPEAVVPASDTSVSPSIAGNKFAIDLVAASAYNTTAKAPFDIKKRSFEAVLKPPLTDKAMANPAATQAAPSADTWRVGTLQTLYGKPVTPKIKRWLLLLESPEAALQSDFNALAGDAGKLLDNMLRAAKLNTAAVVLLAPLVRVGTGGDLPGVLTELLVSAKADVVLVMGRLAAQAILQAAEPLLKLRGQVHTVQNQQTIVTFAPSYLLGNPLEKAKAWDDLCLAICVARAS